MVFYLTLGACLIWYIDKKIFLQRIQRKWIHPKSSIWNHSNMIHQWSTAVSPNSSSYDQRRFSMLETLLENHCQWSNIRITANCWMIPSDCFCQNRGLARQPIAPAQRHTYNFDFGVEKWLIIKARPERNHPTLISHDNYNNGSKYHSEGHWVIDVLLFLLFLFVVLGFLMR